MRSTPGAEGQRSSPRADGATSRSLPRLARLAFRLLVPRRELEFFLGDLEEQHARDAQQLRARDRSHHWIREMAGALPLGLGNRARQPGRPATSRGDGMMRDLVSDLRMGVRLMRRSPAFTGVAVVTLALGIGTTTAVFSLVNAVLLKPFPYPHADRIVDIRENNLPRGWDLFAVSPLNAMDWQDRSRSFARMALYRRGWLDYTGGGDPESLHAYQVADGYLGILAGEPTLGRAFSSEEYLAEGRAVAIVSHGFWQRALGGTADVVGCTLTVDGTATEVVGVLPVGWRPPFGPNPEIVIPLRPQPWWQTNRDSHFLRMVAKLDEGVTLQQAQQELSAVAMQLQEDYPDTNQGWGVVIRSLRTVVAGQVRGQLLLLLTAVAMVLLIGCANVANMMLARASGRSREMAVRAALGAGSGRVVRQLLAESVVVSLAGGVLGVGLAWAAVRTFTAGWPDLLPRMEAVSLDLAVLLFAAAVSVGSGLLFGLVPALGSARLDLGQALRQRGRSIAGGGSSRRLRAGLVVVEVGLAVVLLVGSGLLMRSFAALSDVDPGFEPADCLILSTRLPEIRYPSRESRASFADAVIERLAALPGVTSASVSTLVPVTGLGDEINTVFFEGRPEPAPGEEAGALRNRISPDYFRTLGIPLLAGRPFTVSDQRDTPLVAVVSESFVRRYLPGQEPLGLHMRDGRNGAPMGIVGVAGDVQHYELGETVLPQYYTPFSQTPLHGLQVVVAAAVPPESLAQQVRGVIREVDPDLPVLGLRSLSEAVSESISLPRFRTSLMTAFGAAALLLAAVGLYGVLSYSVTLRTREIGIRVALGAGRGRILALVLREGGALVSVGTVLGILSSLALGRLLESVLFGVGSRDPAIFAAVPVLLAVVAGAAMLTPALRAVHVDPVTTLAED